MYGTKILTSILQTMTGEWQPPEGSEVAQPPRDNPITGHVIQRLFNMVSPPTVSNSYSLLNTVNQLLFTMNLFRDLLEIIWFAVTYVHVQALIHSTPLLLL